MTPIHDYQQLATRRTFLGATTGALGSTALSALLSNSAFATSKPATRSTDRGLASLPHFAPKAKRVLCLFQAEGFSHVDLFDNKPALQDHHGKDLPASIKGTQRVTGM